MTDPVSGSPERRAILAVMPKGEEEASDHLQEMQEEGLNISPSLQGVLLGLGFKQTLARVTGVKGEGPPAGGESNGAHWARVLLSWSARASHGDWGRCDCAALQGSCCCMSAGKAGALP